MSIAETLDPPYYAVVFTSVRSSIDDGYDDMAACMVELAQAQPGFLGVESVRENGVGITVSYWTSAEAVARWKQQVEHRQAQHYGRTCWYRRYRVRVARVERDYGFDIEG